MVNGNVASVFDAAVVSLPEFELLSSPQAVSISAEAASITTPRVSDGRRVDALRILIMFLPPKMLEKEGEVTPSMSSPNATHQSADRPSFEDRLSHTETGDRTCPTKQSVMMFHHRLFVSITVAGQCRIFTELRWDLYYTSFDVLRSH
jgi:hypothetical protein